MQQRIYRSSDVTPQDLANHLVDQYANSRRMRGQVIGSGDSLAVQVGREGRTPAMTLGIVRSPDEPDNLIVTMGEQQWIGKEGALYSAAGSLVGGLYSPFSLFGLIWPAKHILSGDHSVQDAWNLIESYMIQRGATLVQDQTLAHPHLS